MSRIYIVRAATDATDAEIIQTAQDAQATINALTIERDALLQRVAELEKNYTQKHPYYYKAANSLAPNFEVENLLEDLINAKAELLSALEDMEQLEKDNAELREGHDATALKLSAAQERNRGLKSTLMKIEDALEE